LHEGLPKETIAVKGKRIKESSVTMSHVMLPEDANPVGNVHGGVAMKLIDTAAGVVAIRHSRRPCVTASVDRLDFHHPVYVGDLLILKASLNMVGKSSMEIGVRVESEDLIEGEIHHTASAYLTMVALGDDGRPTEVPPLFLEIDDEKRRNREAKARREARLTEKRKEEACQQDAESCEL